MAILRDYATILRQLGARTTIRMKAHQAPRGGPNFFDEESSDDGLLLQRQRTDVGDESQRTGGYLNQMVLQSFR